MVEARLRVLILCLLVGAAVASKCGQKKTIVQEFIANGYKAMAGSWPWHGAMFHKRQSVETYVCGITILTEQTVITATHCTFDQTGGKIKPDRVIIKVGVTNLAALGKYAQIIGADRIIQHDSYDDSDYENDITLIKLNDMIKFTSYVQPICLWQGDSSLEAVVSKVGYIVGWGLDEKGSFPTHLNEATMPIVSKRDCKASNPDHYRRVYHDSKTFCASYRNGTGTSVGDSGGGMYLLEGNMWFLRGIVSNGRLDPNTLLTDTASFVVFTDVASYLPWIRQHVTIDNEILVTTPPPLREQPNLLGINSCGKDKYPLGTQEEFKLPINQYPWLVALEYYNPQSRAFDHLCHGVLIHPKFVLTVVQCLRQDKVTLRSVRLNDYRLDTEVDSFEQNGQKIRMSTERITIVGSSIHPDFDNSTFTNNIALLMLNKITKMTPICLPPKGQVLPEDISYNIIGWKRNSPREKPMVRNVVQLADFKTCIKMYATQRVKLDRTGGQVCSNYNHDDEDGGCSKYKASAPFQYVLNGPTEGRYFLAALSSIGHVDCRRDDFAEVFTNVVHYADWIRDKIKANENKVKG